MVQISEAGIARNVPNREVETRRGAEFICAVFTHFLAQKSTPIRRGNPLALTDTTTLPALLRQNEEEDDDVNHVNRKGLERGDGDGEGEGNFPED